TKDDTRLYVSVIGPGAVSVDEFNINNWPDYSADPNCTEIWKAKETERSFVITGATAETQIRFLGRALDLREATGATINKNRIFLDDIIRSEEHTSELQSRENLVCRLLLEKKKKIR